MFLNNVVKFFQEGGFFMYVVLVISMFGVSISAERLYFMVIKYNINANAFMLQITKLIKDGRMADAIKLCKSTGSILPKIILSALENASKDEKDILNAVDIATMEVIPQVEKRTHYLAMLANIATLTGLLGTISGLIQAFGAIGAADPSQKAELLSKGISEAMNVTMVGIAIAIPMLIIYSIVQAKAKKILDDIDIYSTMLINTLMESKKEGLRRG